MLRNLLSWSTSTRLLQMISPANIDFHVDCIRLICIVNCSVYITTFSDVVIVIGSSTIPGDHHHCIIVQYRQMAWSKCSNSLATWWRNSWSDVTPPVLEDTAFGIIPAVPATISMAMRLTTTPMTSGDNAVVVFGSFWSSGDASTTSKAKS